MKTKALIIDIDEYKKSIPDYKPKVASIVHSRSARQANEAYEQAIRSNKYRKVILMSGGSASGKTEFVHSHLFDEDAIIFDSTLSTKEGAKVKIRNTHKFKLKIEIILIIPDSLERSYIAFLNRERKMRKEIFFQTHIGSRETVLFLAKNKFDAKIRLVESSYINRTMKYRIVNYSNRNTLIEYLESIQINKQDILNIVHLIT